MTLQRFQGLVLKLGNQMFVRHYLWLNYPDDPQLMGLQFINNPVGGPRGRASTCNCGTCQKCQHREYMRKYRPKEPDGMDRLYLELAELGFSRGNDNIWTIERQESA